jgi:protein-disulfide isomerase
MKQFKALSLMVALVSSTGTLLATSHAASDTGSFTPAQTQQVQTIVHDYLLQNPQILIEVSNKLQQQQMSEMEQKATGLIHQYAKTLLDTSHSLVLGNPHGKITVIEFYDFQCHHCRDSASAFDDIIKNNSDVRIIFRDLPIFGGESDNAAKASLAAYNLDPTKYLAFHDALMAAPIPFDKNTIQKAAEGAGYDYAKLSPAMQDKQIEAVLKANFELAEKLLEPTINVVATPAIIIMRSDTAETSTAPVVFIPGQISTQQLQDAINRISQ